jgi:broad specificity phosphatase PhoE
MTMRARPSLLLLGASFLRYIPRCFGSAISPEHGFSMALLNENENGESLSTSKQCKNIYFVRHAEGIHNRDSREIPNFENTLSLTEHYRDAPLTEKGIQQSKILSKDVASLAVPPELVVVSPLRRAIHTAQLAFRPSESNTTRNDALSPPFLATELARERISVHTCDWRRPRSAITADFPFVDMSMVATEDDEMWERKEMTPHEYSSIECSARAALLLDWLLERREHTIAVVAHWVFYTHLFGLFVDREGSIGEAAALQSKFGNAEMRKVRLCSSAPPAGGSGAGEL